MVTVHTVTIIFFWSYDYILPTAILLATRLYIVSRTHTYNKFVQINLAAE